MTLFEHTDPATDTFYEARVNNYSYVYLNDRTVEVSAVVEIMEVTSYTVKMVKSLDLRLRIHRIDEGFPVLRELGYLSYLKGVVIQNLLKDKLDIKHLVFVEGSEKPPRWQTDRTVESCYDVGTTKCDQEFVCPFNLAWMATVAQRVEDALADLPKHYEDGGRDFFEKR